MTEPAQVEEPLDHRAAGRLNGVMYAALSIIAFGLGSWLCFTSLSDFGAISGGMSDRQETSLLKAVIGLSFALSGIATLLPNRKRRSPK